MWPGRQGQNGGEGLTSGYKIVGERSEPAALRIASCTYMVSHEMPDTNLKRYVLLVELGNDT